MIKVDAKIEVPDVSVEYETVLEVRRKVQGCSGYDVVIRLKESPTGPFLGLPNLVAQAKALGIHVS